MIFLRYDRGSVYNQEHIKIIKSNCVSLIAVLNLVCE
jgi:hypothetical protein